MSDPIKEQAEKIAQDLIELLKSNTNNIIGGYTVEKTNHEILTDAIEKHLREKEELRAEMEASLIGQEHRLGSKVEMQEQEIKALEAEIERLRNPKDCIIVDRDVFDEMLGKRRARKEKESSIRLDLVNKLQSLEAHNLELTQALKAIRDFEDDDNDDSFTLGVCKAKAEQILSSPASRKYLAMIAVVEAAKEWGKNKDSHKESQIKLCDAIVNIEALESEEANEGD